MAEVYLQVRSYGVMTIRIDQTAVRGDGSPTRRVLRLPFEVQILSIQGKQQTIDYTIIRMAGVIKMKDMQTLAEFEARPLSEESNSGAFFRQLYIEIPLDLPTIEKFEEARSRGDAFLFVSFSGLLWFPKEAKFEKITSASDLQFSVPRSTWTDQVLPRWGLSTVKLVEIRFPQGTAGDNFRNAYARVEAAEKSFANGLYKQVLTELRLSFEALAISLEFKGQVKECLESLFADSHPDKREKARDALNGLYRFLHLGPHEQGGQAEAGGQPVVLRRDARFALTMAYAIFEYITPRD